MGPENAAATMACILERGGDINSAGGYLRDLTARSRRGKFSLGPALMALMRANGEDKKRALISMCSGGLSLNSSAIAHSAHRRNGRLFDIEV